MQANRQIFIYNLIKTTIENLTGSPIEFVNTTDFDDLLEGNKPRLALELLSDVKEERYRNSTVTRLNGEIDYQMLVGIKVGRDADFRAEVYKMPELLEDAIQSISLPNIAEITGKNYNIEVKSISSPNPTFAVDFNQKQGYIFFNGQINYLKIKR